MAEGALPAVGGGESLGGPLLLHKDIDPMISVLVRTLDKKEFNLQVSASQNDLYCRVLPRTAWQRRLLETIWATPKSAIVKFCCRCTVCVGHVARNGQFGACSFCECFVYTLHHSVSKCAHASSVSWQVRRDMSVEELKREVANSTSIAVESQRLMS